MSLTLMRANVEYAKALLAARLGDEYIYAGTYDRNDPKVGADCSGSAGIYIGAALLGAAGMAWGRLFSTETFPGPFAGFRQTTKSDLLVGNYPIKVCIHHGGGGPNSHMQIQIDGVVMESNGSHGTCTAGTGAMDPADDYWNDWWVFDGTIAEDGTAGTVIEPPDTLFADVSYYQAKIDDSYPYRVISFRSNDGTFTDPNFAANLAWAKKACDSGKLACFLVYFVWRPGAANAAIVQGLIGDPHPKMAVEIDIESWGGQIGGDQSAALNATHDALARWLGDGRRVIAYGNTGDLNNLWPTKPAGLQIRLAAYGSNPGYPGKIAHQYTDGQGYGGGLPEGAPPFGNCDMNSADGYTATAFAAALGIDATPPTTPVNPPQESGMLASTSIYATPGEGAIYTEEQLVANIDGFSYEDRTEKWAARGNVDAMVRILKDAAGIGRSTDPDLVAYAQATLTDLQTANPTRFAATIAKVGQSNPAVLQAFLAATKGVSA